MGDKGKEWLRAEKNIAARVAKNVEAQLDKSGQPVKGTPKVVTRADKKKAKKDKK